MNEKREWEIQEIDERIGNQIRGKWWRIENEWERE